MKGVTQWVLDWGLPIAVLLGALYIFAARAESPSEVYRVFTLIDAPQHVLLWLASLVGWLLVPAIIGGFAGHVIAERISRAKSISTHTLFQQRKWRQRMRPLDLLMTWPRTFMAPMRSKTLPMPGYGWLIATTGLEHRITGKSSCGTPCRPSSTLTSTATSVCVRCRTRPG